MGNHIAPMRYGPIRPRSPRPPTTVRYVAPSAEGTAACALTACPYRRAEHLGGDIDELCRHCPSHLISLVSGPVEEAA